MTSVKGSGPDRVRRALKIAGINALVSELPASTRTAAEAAEAVGCTVGQIAKSLVFKGADDQAYLVIASGDNQVDVAKLGRLVAEEVTLADPDFVRQQTGYAIGGVPPLGHRQELPTFFDRDLLHFDEIWAAAGSPKAVFRIDPEIILEVTGANLADIKLE